MALLAAYVLVVVAPLTIAVPLGTPVTAGVLPFYVQAAIELSDEAAVVLLLAGGVRALSERQAAPVSITRSFAVVPLALAGLGLVTAPLALSPPLAAYSAVRWLLAAGVAVALVSVRIPFRGTVMALSLGLVPHIAIGIGQVLAQGPLGLPGELARRPSDLGAAIVATNGEPWLRAYGLTFHPNVLGGFLCVAIILLLPLLDRLWLRMVWWLLWVGLILTFSRSAWLATALALAVAGPWLVLQGSPLRRAIVGAFAGVVIVGLMGGTLLASQFLTRLTPILATVDGAVTSERGESFSLMGRASMVRTALVAIAEHPIAGVGAGNFPLEMLRQRTHTSPQYVHNVPLLLASEVGVLGGVIWIAAWLAGVGVLVRRWRRLTPDGVTALAAWFAIGIIALFDCYPWSLQAGRLLTVVTLALVDRARTTALHE